jgi:lipid-A-disaccharide synthase
MVIAGETSGDTLAAELVEALRIHVAAAESEATDDVQPLRTALEPRFFGAGGPRMAAAGVELAFDMTGHAVTGVPGLRKYFKLRRLFNQLLSLAVERQPDAIIGVDYGYFNLRFGHAIRHLVRARRDQFHPWNPKIIQFVSPQVWASREGRAYQIARDYDLLLSIFPFEQAWYAKRVPKLWVEFVGHPMVDRFANCDLRLTRETAGDASKANHQSQILLLPGSRPDELRRHLPVMLGALKLIREKLAGCRAKMVLPNDSLAQQAKAQALPPDVDIQIGGLPQALAEASLAIASTGTVTMECACHGVPAVTLYKTSWTTYQIGKRIVKVKWLTMPNLLANEEIFPEFIQNAATPENISRAAIEILSDEPRRAKVKTRLAEIVASLGDPGASQRAAQAIVKRLTSSTPAPTSATIRSKSQSGSAGSQEYKHPQE